MENHNHQPTLCTKGCGFFGSSLNGGMCSICSKKATQPVTIPRPNSPAAATTVQLVTSASLQVQATQANSAHKEPKAIFSPPEPCGILPEPVSSGMDAVSSIPQHTEVLQNSEISPLSPEQVGRPPVDECIEEARTDSAHHKSRSTSRTRTGLEDALGEHAASRSSSNSSRTSSGNRKINRCKECEKRVGLTGYNCRCGGMFCALHRYSDVHKCEFDYRMLGTEEIRKNNPVVKGDKIRKL